MAASKNHFEQDTGDPDQWRMSLGAVYLGDSSTRFRVWAPKAHSVEVHLHAPEERLVPLEHQAWGYFEAVVPRVEPGALYKYRLDHRIERPDPASQFQPHGIHEASQVVDPVFAWTDHAWRGIALEQYIFYELHIGTFTPEGTFAGVERQLDYLAELGVTAVELMPVAQFPGDRNWGYDGVHPFAVQNSYGGPIGLKRFVDACHGRGLAVVLDVVYNHLGPEGNYLGDFGPYFSERYRIRWGQAINFDGRASDAVRQFFIDNVLFWVIDFHIDALRMDAVHAIYDQSATHILAEMAGAVHQQAQTSGRTIHLLPESGQNNPRLTERPEQGGYGLDAEWNEDFHRALHSLMTGERNGYYGDYGRLEHLAKAYRDGYVFDGQYVAYRGRKYGAPSRDTPAERFVVYSQNHDQTGNRFGGERLGHLVDFESQKLAAAAVLLSPFLPLLFMGEEYGEDAPFLYFISHLDPALVEAVRNGRRADFETFGWRGDIADPQSAETFERSRLDHGLRSEGRHCTLLKCYRELIALRKTVPALRWLSKRDQEVTADESQNLLTIRRWTDGSEALVLLNFANDNSTKNLDSHADAWQKRFDSSDAQWDGPGGAAVRLGDHGHGAIVELLARSAVLLVRQT